MADGVGDAAVRPGKEKGLEDSTPGVAEGVI